MTVAAHARSCPSPPSRGLLPLVVVHVMWGASVLYLTRPSCTPPRPALTVYTDTAHQRARSSSSVETCVCASLHRADGDRKSCSYCSALGHGLVSPTSHYIHAHIMPCQRQRVRVGSHPLDLGATAAEPAARLLAGVGHLLLQGARRLLVVALRLLGPLGGAL